MCGISGFFNSQGKTINRNYLERFGKIQSHRGPDNTGYYYAENIGFCHNRLSIIDVSENGNQPFQNERYTLIYNGEIYNFQEIRGQLEKLDVVFQSTSDTEVLFYALIHFGVEKTIQTIKGMFAFAFFDSDEQQLFLVRDRIGIKPLFYCIQNDTLFFASEFKALVSELPLELDEIRALYSTVGVLEKSRYETIFKDVFQVPPGAYVCFDKSGLKRKQYFKLSDLIEEQAYSLRKKAGFKNNLEEFHQLFDQAIQRMLISDAPMGAYVSGGIDSSLIATYAAKHATGDFKLFTANILGKYSEFGDAQLLAKSINKELYDYPFQPEFFTRDWTKVTWHYESPIVVHANAVPFSNVSGLARQLKVKAVLTGEGSDEMFLGYPKLLTRRYNNLIQAPFNLLNHLYGLIPPLKRYVQGGGTAGIEGLFEKATQNFTRDLIRNEGMKKLEFIPQKVRKEHYLSLQMLNEGIVSLLWRNDRMGMIHSIEARFPFLDEDVLEFAVNLPSENKIGRTSRFHNFKHPFLIDKKIVRSLAEDKLPNSLVYKKKNGFPLFGLQYLRTEPSFFREGFVSELLKLNSQLQVDFFTTGFNSYHIAKFAALEVWGRLFVWKDSIEAVNHHVNSHVKMAV